MHLRDLRYPARQRPRHRQLSMPSRRAVRHPRLASDPRPGCNPHLKMISTRWRHRAFRQQLLLPQRACRAGSFVAGRGQPAPSSPGRSAVRAQISRRERRWTRSSGTRCEGTHTRSQPGQAGIGLADTTLVSLHSRFSRRSDPISKTAVRQRAPYWNAEKAPDNAPGSVTSTKATPVIAPQR